MVKSFRVAAAIIFPLLMGGCLKDSWAQKEETLNIRGGRFVDGRFGRGFLAEREGDRVLLPTKGKLRKEEGTIEMWVRHVLPPRRRPEWAPLFTAQIEPYTTDFLKIRGLIVQFIENSKQIIFVLGEIGETRNVLVVSGLDWRAGEDHHVTVSWGRSGMRIYLDGREAARNGYTGSLPSLPENLCVGCYAWEVIHQPAQAVIDDLRISGVQRSAQEIAETFRAAGPVPADSHTLAVLRFEERQIVDLAGQRGGREPKGERAASPEKPATDLQPLLASAGKWRKHEKNPVYHHNPFGDGTKSFIGDPSVLHKEGKFYLFYPSGLHAYLAEANPGVVDGVILLMEMATSNDGTTWKKFDRGTPNYLKDDFILLPDSKRSWDSLGLETPTVLFDESDRKFKMWYAGGNLEKGFKIGYADSSDGIHWKKYDDPRTTKSPYDKSDPVMSPRNDKWDNFSVNDPVVIKEGKTFKMWYAGIRVEGSKGYAAVGYAESDDGISWRRLDKPVLEPHETREGNIANGPTVLRVKDYRLMHSSQVAPRVCGLHVRRRVIVSALDLTPPTVVIAGKTTGHASDSCAD